MRSRRAGSREGARGAAGRSPGVVRAGLRGPPGPWPPRAGDPRAWTGHRANGLEGPGAPREPPATGVSAAWPGSRVAGSRRRNPAGVPRIAGLGPDPPGCTRGGADAGPRMRTRSRERAGSGTVHQGGFPSGQRGQTVNLMAAPSKVRILHPPLAGQNLTILLNKLAGWLELDSSSDCQSIYFWKLSELPLISIPFFA